VIIISKGIDLSVGTAMALCATTLAWGVYEDVGYLARHGTNFHRASQQFEQAQRALAGAPTPQAQVSWQAEVEYRREALLAIATAKLRQARSEARAAPAESSRQAVLRANVAGIEKKISQIKDAGQTINVDDAWLQQVPNSPWTAPIAVLIGLLTGIAAGLLNGVLISALRIAPFVATLGSMTVYLGIGNLISDNKPIRPTLDQVPQWLSSLVSNTEDAFVFGLPTGVWLMLALAVLLVLILRYSVFGRHVFAVGSNEATARLCGINVSLTKIAVYALAGAFVGIAGVYYFARLSVGNPTEGLGVELDVIAAVVIGGASLSGGRGSVLGSIAGAAMVVVIDSGCTQLGLPDPIQRILVGAIIIGAVAIDQWRLRRAEG
jgi:ribose/xylose/arabinose/galactoside ABC-type transport system permease subunit